MKFLLTYTRFTYHTMALAHAKNGKPNKLMIFTGLTVLTFPMLLLGVSLVVDSLIGFSFINWFDSSFNTGIQLQRGTLTPSIILFILISSLIVYWICISSIGFDNIPKELEKFDFFTNNKIVKALIFIASGPIFALSSV